ncbi:MAG: DJ-1/PfpI family protein [Opitutaceae bacterium]
MLNVAVFIYDEVEVLDFAGPFEVFGTASRLVRRDRPPGVAPFRVLTVGERRITVRARGGLTVLPEFGFGAHPRPDVLLISGGVVEPELRKPAVETWLRAQAAGAQVVASVCTGAFLLAKIGLLDGLRATTHWEDIADLRAAAPRTRIEENVRWIDEGRVVTSAGISAGIDMSLHLVERLAGRELAERTARQMDYAVGAAE